MKYFLISVVLLVALCARPEILSPFDTLPGRTLLLAGVIYLVQVNLILGVLAAFAFSRVFDRVLPAPAAPAAPPDLLRLSDFLRPQPAHTKAFIKTDAMPDASDPFFHFALV